MSNNVGQSAPSSPPPRKFLPSIRQVRRAAIVALTLVAGLGGIGIAVPWCYYRCHHVVLGKASVKGTVTKVGARIDGRVSAVEVELGQRVSKGQVLLKLEDRHLQAALDRAHAELESATRDLESEKLGIEHSRRRLNLETERVKGVRKKAGAEVEAQTSNLVSLQKQYERVTSLYKSGAAATSEMDRITGDRDRAQALVDAATGALEAAESNYEKAMNELDGLTVRETRLGVLESQVAAARARVATAEADLEATIIRAPDDGRVLERIVEVGGSARVGEPMISLWIGRGWIEAWADEKDLQRIQIGSRADVVLDACPNYKLSGRVEAIGLMSDKQLQPNPVPSDLHAILRQDAMVPVRIALAEDNSRVQLGLSAEVGIHRGAAGHTPTAGVATAEKQKKSTFDVKSVPLAKANQ